MSATMPAGGQLHRGLLNGLHAKYVAYCNVSAEPAMLTVSTRPGKSLACHQRLKLQCTNHRNVVMLALLLIDFQATTPGSAEPGWVTNSHKVRIPILFWICSSADVQATTR